MPDQNEHLELSDQTFRQLTGLIYSNSGLRFEDSAKYMIRRRLSPRVRELKLDSFEKYYYYLLYHANRESELEIIFDLLTVNETYFFREERQLHAFSEEIIPLMVEEKKNNRVLRIWSAGCSTGEEPYTIAMLCCASGLLRDWEIDIFASDISQRVIQTARRGTFGQSSFRNMPEGLQERYFEKLADNRYRINDGIKQMVTFGKVNLFDEHKTGILNEVDLIFCRNVIIYFDVEAKKRVIETFYRKLRKNGFLLLGHAESLLSLSTKFKLTHFKHDMVYQK
ncbi:MAG TPA: protein-glutamate O-methyltransferase CheR [Acidobacteriota bacterium]|jgi:chemotaxis protein methyltransferase CheR